jgi:quercetin dioxygenase-like cupin family protein
MRIRTAFPIEPLLVRYADLVSMNVAGPAEHFTLIESDPSEPVAADASIALPHGFNLKAERRIASGGRIGHSSPVAEVLVVHAGRWRLTLGAGNGDGADLGAGDVASVPPNLFRRWEKLDGEMGFLFIVQGLHTGTDLGDGTAAPESAADERRRVQDGRFIDFSSGIPRMREVDGRQDRPAAPRVPFRINAGLIAPCGLSALTARGVVEAGIISPPGTRDGFAQGAIGAQWPHGFNLRSLILQSGAYVPRHARAESEVILVQAGMLEISWPDGSLMLGAGDVLSVPVGLPHALRNTTSRPTEAVIVRGSDDPAMPQFDSMSTLDVLKTSGPSARA